MNTPRINEIQSAMGANAMGPSRSLPARVIRTALYFQFCDVQGGV